MKDQKNEASVWRPDIPSSMTGGALLSTVPSYAKAEQMHLLTGAAKVLGRLTLCMMFDWLYLSSHYRVVESSQ